MEKKPKKSINSTMTTALHGIVWQVCDPLVNTQWNSSIFNLFYFVFFFFLNFITISQSILILLTFNVRYSVDSLELVSLSISFPISIEIENNLSQISSEVKKSNKNHFKNEIDACFERFYWMKSRFSSTPFNTTTTTTHSIQSLEFQRIK